MDNKILYTAKFTHHDLKFHKVWWKLVRTDRQTDRFLYTPQTIFAGDIIIQLQNVNDDDLFTARQNCMIFHENS